jgi:hypothetical protein|uniref:hypothetical protein n=1 Tax=Prosthecobacter sp. TaxID=1965333 RepID=UPI00378336B3
MTLETTLLDALQSAAAPLKAAQITKLVKPAIGRAATPKNVTAALDALVSTGSLNRIGSGAKSLFTPLSQELAAAALLKPLIHAAKKEQPAARLKLKLPAVLQAHFDSALTQLSGAGDAFVLPGAKRLVYAQKPRPSDLLSATQRRAVQKLLDGVNAARSQAATLVDFMAWLDDEAPASVEPPQVPSVVEPDETLLHEWYKQDALRSSTMMIPIPRTFGRYAAWANEHGGLADSQVLRNLLETLYNQGRILLEPCERPQDLPEHERSLLVPMSLGPPGYSWCWIA